MAKYKIIVEYDGTDFVGWQKQENGPSIQSSLEDAIKKITSETVSVFGAGRTDSGVHAKGQVAHFEFSKNISLDKAVKQWGNISALTFGFTVNDIDIINSGISRTL